MLVKSTLVVECRVTAICNIVETLPIDIIYQSHSDSGYINIIIRQRRSIMQAVPNIIISQCIQKRQVTHMTCDPQQLCILIQHVAGPPQTTFFCLFFLWSLLLRSFVELLDHELHILRSVLYVLVRLLSAFQLLSIALTECLIRPQHAFCDGCSQLLPQTLFRHQPLRLDGMNVFQHCIA